MSAGRKLLVYILVGCYAVFNTGFTVDALVWAPATNTNLDIQLQLQQWNFAVKLSPKSSTTIPIDLTNIGNTVWQPDQIYLAGVLPTSQNNYPFTLTPQTNWTDINQTLSYANSPQLIPTGEVFNFILPIKAPDQSGWYRMYFQPIIHNSPVNRLIRIDLEVGQTPQTLAVTTTKHIEVNIANQTADLYEGQFKLAHLDASTGRSGMDTPPGRYTINKKYLDVWSIFAEMRLPYWLELRNEAGVFEGYGIHGVPYHNVTSSNYVEGKTYDGFRYYTDGKLYEGYDFIGKAFTQGCVVLSLTNAEMVYDWAELDKTIVNIQ
ncbi:L,D-transpeptidase [Patescibacteria group bacterium]|nr:L,D-transpeptidase [Patescibacteria group bacterium]